VVEFLLPFAVVAMLWQGFAMLQIMPPQLFPGVGHIAATFWRLLANGILLVHALGTLARLAAGFALGGAVGVALGILMGRSRWAEDVFLPLLSVGSPIPGLAYAPLFVIWFGLGAEPKVLLAFLLGLFPIFVNSLTGLSEIEPDVLDLARLAGGTELRIFTKVRLMHAVPYIMDAVKVAFPLALVGSIVGEFIGGNRGVGYLVLSGQFNLDTPLVFASLLSITLFTTLGIGVVALLENVLLAWRPSRRER